MSELVAIIDKHLAHRSPGDKQCRFQLIASLTDLLAGAWDAGRDAGIDEAYDDLRGISTDPGHGQHAQNPYRQARSNAGRES